MIRLNATIGIRALFRPKIAIYTNVCNLKYAPNTAVEVGEKLLSLNISVLIKKLFSHFQRLLPQKSHYGFFLSSCFNLCSATFFLFIQIQNPTFRIIPTSEEAGAANPMYVRLAFG